MENIVKVGISDYKIAQGKNKLMTLGLGSCVAIVIYDPAKKIGGLSHIMLPDSQLFQGRKDLKIEKFADLAIPVMIHEIRKAGSTKNLVAKIAGGASMFQFSEVSKLGNIGDRNVKMVTDILKQWQIPLISSHTGGNIGRSVTFDLDTAKMEVKMVNREKFEI